MQRWSRGCIWHRLRFATAEADLKFAAPAQPRTAKMEEQIQGIPANALLAQLVEHFHGKEGVVGSSPTEGFLANQHFLTDPSSSWRAT
jgi:hypothetical protein